LIEFYKTGLQLSIILKKEYMPIVKSLIVFIFSGFCEIGGGYLVWLWLKANRPFWYGLIGGIVLAIYGIAATLQTANFGRVYATYGGVFIVMSLLWGWKVDQFIPDRYDIIGAFIALIGVAVMFYAPRN
jgi:small multidrug resistance family-3 protein